LGAEERVRDRQDRGIYVAQETEIEWATVALGIVAKATLDPVIVRQSAQKFPQRNPLILLANALDDGSI